MRCECLSGILAWACLLMSGCSAGTNAPPGGDGPDPKLNDAVDVVGATWKDQALTAKDTGGPTVVPPKVTSNSPESFDIEVTEVVAGQTTEDVAQLRIAIQGFLGHYALDVGPDDRTPAGTILATVIGGSMPGVHCQKVALPPGL